MKNYPCKNCILLLVCKDFCKKVILNGHLSKIYFKKPKNRTICPDCGSNLILSNLVAIESKRRQGEFYNDYHCINCKRIFMHFSSDHYERHNIKQYHALGYTQEQIDDIYKK